MSPSPLTKEGAASGTTERTDGDGTLTFTGLELGVAYTLTETAPNGYETIDAITVTLSEDAAGVVTLAASGAPAGTAINQDTLTLTIPNALRTKEVTLIKRDGEGNLLGGAAFTTEGLTWEGTTDVGPATFKATLQAGKSYVVTESTVPADFNGVSPFTMKLGEDGQTLSFVGSHEGVTIENGSIVVTNTRKNTGSITLTKTEGSETGPRLADAQFTPHQPPA